MYRAKAALWCDFIEWQTSRARQVHVAKLPGVGVPVYFGLGSRLVMSAMSVPLESITLWPPEAVAARGSPLPQIGELVADVKHLQVLVIKNRAASGDIGMVVHLSATLRRLSIEKCPGITGESATGPLTHTTSHGALRFVLFTLQRFTCTFRRPRLSHAPVGAQGPHPRVMRHHWCLPGYLFAHLTILAVHVASSRRID